MPRPQELERQCALTREVKPIADLIRFAVSPDDELVPDTDALAEGRGVWITLGEKQLIEAIKRKAFQKSLKSEVRLPEDLPGLTRKRLTERYISALQMARKAGQLLTGSGKVKDAIEKGDVIALISATDAADDGRNKLRSSLKGYEKATEEAGFPVASAPHLEMLDSAQLGLALGNENVIHAALVNGAAAQSALKRALRLARFIEN